jgi:ubiquinone/menaquinone biosynthesis C-methylase UbiE
VSAIADPDRIREVNTRYHDAAARDYDTKWAIDYGETGQRQVAMKLSKALGGEPGRYQRSLEVGAGTGYFTINLLRAGVITEATAIDISSGMLDVLAATAGRFALNVETVQADAERLPFEDGTFNLVLGHAVLHHLPDLETAFAEFARVLAPGGTVVFMGEPSRNGDAIAWTPKRLGSLAAPVWRRLVGAERRNGTGSPAETVEPAETVAPTARPEPVHDDSRLERFVDVHTFDPGTLRRLTVGAGFVDVRIGGEELLANAYGWLIRALEAGTDPYHVPRAWHQFAFRSYLALQWLDGTLLEPRLPAGLFYNLLLSARKPA